MADRKLITRSVSLLVVASLACTSGVVYAADSADDVRVSRSSFYAGGRDQAVPDRVEQTEIKVGSDAGEQGKAGRRSERTKSASSRTETPNTDFWFYTADVILFADEDNDGFYSGIDLLFDADTVYEQADVFAVLYLSREGGPWVEYAETDVFPIYGATSDDDYVVVTDLLAGYPTGSYDILIELYDTWDGAFVAEFGPADTSALSFLPLEDVERDTPPTVVIVEDHGGGAVDVLLAGLLAAALLVNAVRRRRTPASLRARRAPRA